MEKIIVLESILIFGAGFSVSLTIWSRSLKLTIKILYPGFLVSIINKAILILIMFKYNLKTLVLIILKLNFEQIKVEAIGIWRRSNLPNPEIVTEQDFDELWDW